MLRNMKFFIKKMCEKWWKRIGESKKKITKFVKVLKIYQHSHKIFEKMWKKLWKTLEKWEKNW